MDASIPDIPWNVKYYLIKLFLEIFSSFPFLFQHQIHYKSLRTAVLHYQLYFKFFWTRKWTQNRGGLTINPPSCRGVTLAPHVVFPLFVALFSLWIIAIRRIGLLLWSYFGYYRIFFYCFIIFSPLTLQKLDIFGV